MSQKPRILVVDDNDAVRQVIALSLRDRGYEVEAAADASAALDALGRKEFSLALVDIRMPGKDGIWLLERICSEHRKTCVVMVTAVVDVETAVDCLRRGAIDFLAKPVSTHALTFTVDRALGERRMKLELERHREHLEEMVEEQAGEVRKTLERHQRAMMAVVEAIAKMSEMRDPYTSGHQRRVAALSRAIARQMGLSQEQTEGVRVSGYLHDIGMALVPRAIRSELGRLSDYEFKIIMAHPEAGYDILDGLDFPWPVAQAVLQHHERLDGSGYPGGLSGDEISIEARILAVADTVEAMLSNRPYRPPAGLDKALKQVSDNRGVLYDSRVVDACLELFQKRGFDFNSGGGESRRTQRQRGARA